MIELLLPLLLPAQTVVPGQGAPAVGVPRIESVVVIDGVLDEAPWAQAVKLTGFWQWQPVDGRPAEEDTEVLVWYSPEALHFGILARDRYPGSIRATVAERDKLERDDTVTIYLDTFNDRRRAFFFEVNPLGVQQDGVFSEGQWTAGELFGGSTDKNPDYAFDSKGRVTPEGYCVEVRIPFKSLRYPGKGPQRWGINVKRTVQRTGYIDTWTDVRRASASFLAQSGYIEGIHDLKRGLVIETQPFATLVANGSRDSDTGDFTRQSTDVNPGVNLRLGLTNVSFDATVNPDFSQVESDVGQVTANERFALFYPEKRPFFLEGIELFSTPNQLVYTRQIAKPIVGAKFTGKIGRYGIAYLSAVDDAEGGNAVFNILRLRRDLGTDSLMGLTYTDRTGGDDYNRVLAADVRLVFAKLYFIQGQLGGSWTREDHPSQSAPIWELQFDRTGRAWGFNYRLAGIGESFETRSGFVPRNNIVDGHAFNRFSWYGRQGALVECVNTHVSAGGVWPYAGFLGDQPAEEGGATVEVAVQLRGGWTASGELNDSFYRFDRADYAGFEVRRPDGAIEPYDPPEEMTGAVEASFEVGTPTYRMFDAAFELTEREMPIFAEASEGREIRAEATLGLRPSESIRVEATAVFADLTRRRDDSEFARTLIPRLKIEYQPRPSLFLRMVGEFRAERQAGLRDARTGDVLIVDGVPSDAQSDRSLRLDWLFSYEPTPGTSVFFGYGTTLEDAASYAGLGRTSDGFFVKLAYIFRR
ncbi:MAG: DUF5916 domain-containing protein [Acidobacteriota bacterium]